MTNETQNQEFSQPVLDPANLSPGTTGAASEALPETSNEIITADLSKDDDFTRAVADAGRVHRDPGTHLAKSPEEVEGKYALHYMLDGQEIRETHADIPHAVASWQRLKRLGIIAATETL